MAKKSEKKEAPQEGLKFLGLDLENFKNLEKKHIDINGHSILVVGKNGTGKSSLIQALMSPLDTKLLPTEAVKKGEERSRISVKIGGNLGGEYKEYILDMFFTAKDNKGRLVVTNDKGEAIKSPASFVKSLIGNVSFDIMKWLNQSKKDKLETIKKLTGISVELDKIDLEIKTKKETKKYKKQRAEDLEAILNNSQFTAEDREMYSTPIDLLPIQQEMSAISKSQQTYDGVVNKMKEFRTNISITERSIEEKQEQINALQNQIEAMRHEISVSNENIAKGDAWLATHSRPSVEAANEKINQAIMHNEKHNQIGALAGNQREMIKCKEEIGQIDMDVKILEDKKSSIISNSNFKVQGLTFTDDEIFLDDIPLEEGQVNTARLFDVGVEVAMALNPNLKTIFLHDGSLFDKEALAAIIDKIENRGYQAIIELVSENDEVEVKFTEKEL